MRAAIRGRTKKAEPKLTMEQRLLLEQLRGKGYAALPEVRFHPERKWRIDVAVAAGPVRLKLTTQEDMARQLREGEWQPGSNAIAVEIHGGAWSRGRHVRGNGFIADMEKENALVEAGWKVLKFTPQQVLDGSALAQIERCL